MKEPVVRALKHAAVVAGLIAFVLAARADVKLSHAESPRVKARADFGEWVYLNRPDYIIRSIRVAEGVPSYGVMWLAAKYGGHDNVPWQVGRAEAARIMHRTYREWKTMNLREPFLRYLGGKYAPVGARNDPNDLNVNWLQNVALNIAMQIADEESR